MKKGSFWPKMERYTKNKLRHIFRWIEIDKCIEGKRDRQIWKEREKDKEGEMKKRKKEERFYLLN